MWCGFYDSFHFWTLFIYYYSHLCHNAQRTPCHISILIVSCADFVEWIVDFFVGSLIFMGAAPGQRLPFDLILPSNRWKLPINYTRQVSDLEFADRRPSCYSHECVQLFRFSEPFFPNLIQAFNFVFVSDYSVAIERHCDFRLYRATIWLEIFIGIIIRTRYHSHLFIYPNQTIAEGMRAFFLSPKPHRTPKNQHCTYKCLKFNAPMNYGRCTIARKSTNKQMKKQKLKKTRRMQISFVYEIKIKLAVLLRRDRTHACVTIELRSAREKRE